MAGMYTVEGIEITRLGNFIDVIFPFLIALPVRGIVCVKPCTGCDGKAGISQAFVDADIASVIHGAGARAAFDGVAGAAPVQCHVTSFFQRQNSVVFQQHDALCSCFSCNDAVRTLPL